jgi:hypothetical protein
MTIDIKVLDKDVLAEVIKAGPKTTQSETDLARAIVATLEEFSQDDSHCEISQDGEDSRFYRTMVEEVKRCVDIYPEPSVQRVGRMCSAMGLEKPRTSGGKWVAWNDAQLAILRRAFGGA